MAVALSGGADSVALLHACVQRWPGCVIAVHVNHGLQEAAAEFEAFCVAVCQQLNVPLITRTVDAKRRPGQSPEEAARKARYTAFSSLAPEKYNGNAIKSVAIAQHADDQVETLLLALSRGAGLAGLSGMPRHWQRGDLHFYRPFLSVSRAEIRSWLALRELGYVEDPSNTDERYTRNHIRARLMPALASAFPHFLSTFSRSAAHAAEGQMLLTEIAQNDWTLVCQTEDCVPNIKALQNLARARRGNLLRYWLKQQFHATPSAAQLAELLDQIEACTTRGHRIHIKVGAGFVQRKGAHLTWYNP